MLKKIIKNLHNEEGFIFLQANVDDVLFEEYDKVYLNYVFPYPNVDHIFDNELLIKEKLEDFDMRIFELYSIDFKDSKNDIMNYQMHL